MFTYLVIIYLYLRTLVYFSINILIYLFTSLFNFLFIYFPSIGQNGVLGSVPYTRFNGNGIKIPLGSIQTGQTIDTVVCVTVPRGK